MTRRRRHPKLNAAAVAAVAAAGFSAVGVERANADLTIDVRAVAVNGQPLGGENSSKSVVAATGDVVTIDVFAVISGTNGVNDETVSRMDGAFLSTGSLLGTLGATVVAPFNANGHQNGLVQDLDGDGDLDVGSGPNGGVSTHFFLARSNVSENGTVVRDADSEEIQIGVATFTVGAGGESTFVNFARRAGAGGANINTAAVWFQDGNLAAPTVAAYGSGQPVLIAIPEPTCAVAVTGVAALGLLARRGNKR